MKKNAKASVSTGYRNWVLGVLFAIYMLNYIDRALLNIVGQAVKEDLGLSDMQLGLAGGTAFAFINAMASVPIARLAERRNRVAIVSTALAAWSLMTVICGFVQNFLQLVLARAGVGIGEAGGVAPSQSLLADYFPPSKRATALAIFGTATPAGMLIGALGSGWLTDQFSWRVAFIVIGAPGVLVAIVAALTLRELPRGYSEGIVDSGTAPSFAHVLRTLLGRPAYLNLVAGMTVLNFTFFAFLTFYHPLLVRSSTLGYGQAATLYGLVTGIGCGLGYFGSGFLADRLGRRSERWYLWVPAIGAAIAGPALAIGLSLGWLQAIPFLVVACVGSCAWYGPGSAVMHRSVEPRMRATAVALAALITLGGGIAVGPPAVGYLSDLLGGNGLRQALVTVTPMYLWATIHFWIGARALPAERLCDRPTTSPKGPTSS